jgi:hypothetical protein
MVKVPVMFPVAVGSKNTPSVQIAPGARLLVHPVVSAKLELA